MAEIVPKGSGAAQLVLTGDEIPFGAYQAVYHKLTRRVEKLVKAFPEGSTITFTDIENLHHRLRQLLTQYQVKASHCSIGHALKDESSRSHSSFEKFKRSDCSVRACTRSLNYELDFLIVLPPEVEGTDDIAQRYKLRVIIDQDFFEEEMGPHAEIMRDLTQGRSLRMSLEYADFSVAQAINATVTGWVESLPRHENSKITKALLSAEDLLRYNTGSAVMAVALFSGVAALLHTNGPINELLALMLFCIALAYSSEAIVDVAMHRLYRRTKQLRSTTFLTLTQGDVARLGDINKKRNVARGVMSFLLLFVALAIAINISSNWIYDFIFK